MKEYKVSLRKLIGHDYVDALAASASVLDTLEHDEIDTLAHEELTVCDPAYVDRLNALLPYVGTQLMPPAGFSTFDGAPTDAFRAAAHNGAAPLNGIGPFRLGEDGRLYLAAKSEHYHAPLGHHFPGYRLLRSAERLGVTNAAHNNTRGYITRKMEYELIKAANGADDAQMPDILSSHEAHVLNRVINLETGSLACEAGMKMMLARFYRLDSTYSAPKYAGKIPVFFVIGDYDGGMMANYHGTTIAAQTLRGMWPDFYEKAQKSGLYKIVGVNINDLRDFEAKLSMYDSGETKVAGLIHEIILMNYGGIRLKPAYLRAVYRLCHAHDIPTMCDEIQSCMWYKGMFLFRLYELNPDLVIIGKGFPGGNYAASRILLTQPMDTLNQFGALVTNGQQELAALAYLITMDFAQENAQAIDILGRRYQSGLEALAKQHTSFLDRAEGLGLLGALFFKNAQDAVTFVQEAGKRGIETSVQTYKASCPPAALTKPPIDSTEKIIDFIIEAFDTILRTMELNN